MENDDQSHNRDWDDQPEGMRVDGQQEVGVEPCTPYSSQELLAARPSPPEFPLGYRFVPTDQELILYYLKPKVMGDSIPLSEFFANVDLYSFDPRKLIENRKGVCKDADEWYFFTPRDRKYPNGSRPNRCTPSGVWKATGKESIILVENKTIGHKRSLAFCTGTPQGLGDGTAWNMHEYRLEDDRRSHTSTDKEKGVKDKRLDEWVLCKVYTPKHSKNGQKSDYPPKQRNKQNHDRPNSNGDNALTTACKNQGQEKAITANGGFLEDLQSTPSHELNTSQQVCGVDNHQLPQEFSDQCSRRCPDQPTDRPTMFGHIATVLNPTLERVVGERCGSTCIDKFRVRPHSPRASGLLLGSRPAILLPNSIQAGELLPSGAFQSPKSSS